MRENEWMEYNHKKIEKKWQKFWKSKKTYKTDSLKSSRSEEKCYVLDMFPYPSGDGLHVGHPKGYIATDVYSRYKKAKGFSILHPMGWDAFGLPAENFAIKNKIHPEIAVKKNIQTFKNQLEVLGFNYDWDREINTTDQEYYKWTQLIFLEMFKKGLAYESFEPINWCPSCKTGLANEDLEDGKCERCGSVIEKKPMRQWVLKITDYADRLLEDLKLLNWSESIKESQRNWIGKSEGTSIKFKVKSLKFKVETEIEVFTTRPETIFGATYLVLAPEHKMIEDLKPQTPNWKEVEEYINQSKQKEEIERTKEGKEKTGIEINGIKAVNPATGQEIPLWISDYVLAGYGTGAVMAVPSHDKRDFEFAKKFKLEIKQVIALHADDRTEHENQAYTGEGILINSGEFDRMDSEKAREEITKKFGKKITKYKLRDWVFSRQRYWGEPIPLIFCMQCKKRTETQEGRIEYHKNFNKGELLNPGWIAVEEKDLPVKLPKVKSYEPSGTGESPLANIASFVNVKCPKCGSKAQRETNTMPQWAGSSWYYAAYAMKSKTNSLKAKTEKGLEQFKTAFESWLPVDMYIGGAEHATRHLIYARFWHKFLYDMKVFKDKEPFMRFKNVGLIMAPDGRKMSKRFGNVINPDEIVEKWGADTLRIYEMFMGPFEHAISWDTQNMIGSRRFLEKVWRLQEKVTSKKLEVINSDLQSLIHQTIKKVGEDIENFNFNTAISSLMILAGKLESQEKISKETCEIILQLISPFAPHIAEELWAGLGNKKSIYLSAWPTFDPQKIKQSSKLAIQINGKTRDILEMQGEMPEKDMKEKVLELPSVKKWTEGKEVKKIIYVKGKILNIVV